MFNKLMMMFNYMVGLSCFVSAMLMGMLPISTDSTIKTIVMLVFTVSFILGLILVFIYDMCEARS